MESPQSEIGKRIKQLRKDHLGLTQTAFAERIRRDRSTIAKIEAGEELTPATRQSICHEFNVREEWILSGLGEMYKDGSRIFEVIPSCGTAEIKPDEFVNISQFSDRISAGGGLVPINNVEIRVAFRRDWIKRKGDPNKMSLLSVSGDSMFPTLMAGDLVLINHGQNHLDPQGGIYAIALGDVILIKRLQILYPSGKVRVTSDNEKYDSFDLSQEEVKINGRVIWFGREL